MDWDEFDRLVREVLYPVYPAVARKIIEETGITDGLCIDIGTGTGALAIALAKMTDLIVYALDISQRALEIAKLRIGEEGLTDRIFTIRGDVHSMPFKDKIADLIVSRGSIGFWEDRVKAFKEIVRVLKPDGMAVVGGGFGSKEVKEKVKGRLKRTGRTRKVKGEIREILRKAGIECYRIIDDEANFWVIVYGPGGI